MIHPCNAFRCNADAVSRWGFCNAHWSDIPSEIRYAIRTSYGVNEGMSSLPWRIAMYRAIYMIAEKEHPGEHGMMEPVERAEAMKQIVKGMAFHMEKVSKNLGRFIHKR